jgi:inosine-uridine nucleoside N-ribohydrolase
LVDLSLMNHLIIDCDPGHDDFAMLLLALGSPNVVVRAIVCVHGNQSVSHCVPIH